MALLGQMTVMEFILAAAVSAAEANGRVDRVGTLEAGEMGDTLVVDGVPLADISLRRDWIIVVIQGSEPIALNPGPWARRRLGASSS